MTNSFGPFAMPLVQFNAKTRLKFILNGQPCHVFDFNIPNHIVFLLSKILTWCCKS